MATISKLGFWALWIIAALTIGIALAMGYVSDRDAPGLGYEDPLAKAQRMCEGLVTREFTDEFDGNTAVRMIQYRCEADDRLVLAHRAG